MKKPSIPTPAATTDKAVAALKENIEVITGKRGTPIAPLSAAATQAQIIAKVNELLTLLQS